MLSAPPEPPSHYIPAKVTTEFYHYECFAYFSVSYKLSCRISPFCVWHIFLSIMVEDSSVLYRKPNPSYLPLIGLFILHLFYFISPFIPQLL